MSKEALQDVYYSPTTGYLSSGKMYQRMNKEIPFKEVKKFVESQLSNQVLRQPVFNTINAEDPGSNYQLDIMVYDRFTYHNNKYILVVIDVYSRYAHCIAMTNRRMETLIDGVKKCFKVMGKVPKNINCDGEFNKKEFNAFMDEEGIRMWYSDTNEINKNAIVERFNRTLAMLIQRWRVGSGSYDWPKVLNQLVENYNTIYHSRIQATPKEVWEGEKKSMQVRIYLRPTFKVGDKVRIREKKEVFDKGDVFTYSKDIYLVRKMDKGRVYLNNMSRMKTCQEDTSHMN